MPKIKAGQWLFEIVFKMYYPDIIGEFGLEWKIKTPSTCGNEGYGKEICTLVPRKFFVSYVINAYT